MWDPYSKRIGQIKVVQKFYWPILFCFIEETYKKSTGTQYNVKRKKVRCNQSTIQVNKLGAEELMLLNCGVGEAS